MLDSITPNDNVSISHLIDYYEICNRSEGKSQKTIQWYTANLNRFHNYMITRHIPDTIEKVDIKLLREFVLYLLNTYKFEDHPYTPSMTETLSPSTIHGYVRTLRAFFSWLEREEIIERNPAKSLKPPRVPRKVIIILSDEGLKSILGVFNHKNPQDIRNRTMFMILLDSGLRIGELINLRADDVNIHDGILKVLGKGKKERIVPIGNNAQKSLYKYLFRYRPQPAHTEIDHVFLTSMGRPLTENAMKLMFSRLAKRSNIPRLHAHLCRHTFATRFLLNGGDIFTLQQILGHSTLEMVRHYANLASSDIIIQHQKYSPLDRLFVNKS